MLKQCSFWAQSSSPFPIIITSAGSVLSRTSSVFSTSSESSNCSQGLSRKTHPRKLTRISSSASLGSPRQNMMKQTHWHILEQSKILLFHSWKLLEDIYLYNRIVHTRKKKYELKCAVIRFYANRFKSWEDLTYFAHPPKSLYFSLKYYEMVTRNIWLLLVYSLFNSENIKLFGTKFIRVYIAWGYNSENFLDWWNAKKKFTKSCALLFNKLGWVLKCQARGSLNSQLRN